MTPVEHGRTNRFVRNGWCGTEPLPVTDIPGGKAVAIIPSDEDRVALADPNSFIALVIMDDGSVNLMVGGVEVVTEN